MVNVICMKWGKLYGPHYVNRLYEMVAQHLTLDFRFVCFTDDREGIRSEVECMDMPQINIPPENQHLPWRKIGLFNEKLGDLVGPTLFLDLDLIVIDNIDCLFSHPGKFCIIHNWTHPNEKVGNSSVYRFNVGEDSYVLDRFHTEIHQHWIDMYRNSQTFLSNSVRDIEFWPPEWCVSFKKHCLPGGLRNWVQEAKIPANARIVVFHGHPNPDDAARGVWPGGWYKQLKPVSWINEHWLETPKSRQAS